MSTKVLGVPWLFLSITAIGACGGGDPTALGDVEAAPTAYILSSSAWSSPQIPVCWENPDADNEGYRDVVEFAVAATWEDVSDVEFTGWGTCSPGEPGIHIRWGDVTPNVEELGDGLDGLTDGMELNHTFSTWSTDCIGHEAVCVYNTAVHEFGHALGFAHEQNRDDTPSSCTDAPQGTDGDVTLGEWDADSVMNYCNDWYATSLSELSDLDGQAAHHLYGGPWKLTSSGTDPLENLAESEVARDDLYLGDFNGDGRADVFYADGSDWYVSYAGTGSWTDVNTSGYTLTDLAFGDFNGDGRTDVFRASGSKWYVSSSGTGAWTQLATSGYTLGSLAFGDFNGDGRTDVFRASGTKWYVSYSGTGAWTQLATSGHTLGSLAFADFNGDGRTDVFRASGTKWYVSYSGTGAWTQLATSGYTLGSLAFADLDGDNRADVVRANGSALYMASAGTGDWTELRPLLFGLEHLGFGDLDGDGADDVFLASPDSLL